MMRDEECWYITKSRDSAYREKVFERKFVCLSMCAVYEKIQNSPDITPVLLLFFRKIGIDFQQR
jgi:hypothetical protein